MKQHSTDEENNNENKEGNQFGEKVVDTQKIVVLSVWRMLYEFHTQKFWGSL